MSVAFYKRILLVILVALNVHAEQNLKLEQVLILSRHNVRTPLSKNLFEFTPKTWPNWKEKNGYLTAKGVLLEGFMGEFFASWFIKEDLLNSECPSKNDFYVYANTAERTMSSAKAFVSKAFSNCNITIYHTDKQHDPIFNPVIHNSSNTFKIEAKEQMKALLKSLHLNNSYINMETILDYKDSKYCTIKKKCDFINDKNKLFVNTGFKPNLEGPLKICKSVIDSFIMENYEGFPIDEVAWGTLENINQWDAILDLTKSYHNVIFNTSLVAQDVAKPLINFMYDLLLQRQYKISLLMAHDANIYTVLNSMGFEPYILRDQYEVAPVGGKLVFQKWLDQTSRIYYAKVEYVYQVTEQMRAGRKLSLDNPPEFTLLKLNECKVNENGFCLWDDFVGILSNFL